MWERMIALNLTAVVRGSRRVLPGKLERGWGRVITVASTAGLKGYASVTAYSPAKPAVIGLTRSPALEPAGSGVHDNPVSPGPPDTGMLRDRPRRPPGAHP